MSISTWIQKQVKTAITDAVAELDTDSGPLAERIITGVVTGLASNPDLIEKIAAAVIEGVTAGLLADIKVIPSETSGLLTGLLNQLPTQIVQELRNII